jgi:sialate O-acetylesterase
MRTCIFSSIVLLLASWMPSPAKIIMPSIFADHMVLQQNSDQTMWGWSKPLEKVIVTGSWDQKAVQTVADNHANWQVKLATPAAGGPYTLTISGNNTIVLQDVMIGEVWLCSGQSNMEWSAAAGITDAAKEIPNADHPAIRFFQIPPRSADVPQLDCAGEWSVCTPQSMPQFSAVAYFFGRDLNAKLNIPIGLINSSWGGTPAEAWMNPKAVLENEEFAQAAARFTDVPWCPNTPGSAYHAMIAPITRYRIAGVIWYQGESNTLNPLEYRKLFPALIENWRQEWGSEFPFYYVQIAPYKYDSPFIGVLLRESQLFSMSVPKTGMVVVSDIGNIQDIHPRNKRDVGNRLANWALSQTYGKNDIVFSGPVYRSMKKEGNKIRLIFDHAEKGLMCKGDKLTCFQIAGPDSVFMDAEAKISGTSIVVKAKNIKNPVAVRFAWSNTAEPNLFNAEGLPASSFRTDDWIIKKK